MAFQFPEEPTAGQRFPEVGADHITGGIVYQYNDLKNSWDIIGPDNVATTDFVKGAVQDATVAVDKGYDLIAATNVVGIDGPFQYNLNPEANDFQDADVRGRVFDPVDPKPIPEAIELAREEWEVVMLEPTIQFPTTSYDRLSVGQFSVCGTDVPLLEDTLASGVDDPNITFFSTKYKDVTSFIYAPVDEDGVAQDWMNEVSVGDALEFIYELEGKQEYAIYIVTERKPAEHDKSYYSVTVEYVASIDGEEEFKNTIANSLAYRVRTYKKAYPITGGRLDGPIEIDYTGTKAFNVHPLGVGNSTSESIFRINTSENKIFANKAYDALLTTPGYQGEAYVVTLGHLNERLGTNSISIGDKGPYLQLRGGQLEGELDFVVSRKQGAAQNSLGTLKILGKRPGSSNTNDIVLALKHDGAGDFLSYYGQDTADTHSLVNRGMVQPLIDDLEAKKVDKAGDTMTGQLILNGNGSHDYDNPEPKNAAVTKEYVDQHPLGKVPLGVHNRPGEFFENEGILYYNSKIMGQRLKAHNPFYGPQGGTPSHDPRHIDDLYVPFIPTKMDAMWRDSKDKNWDAGMTGGHKYKLYGKSPSIYMYGRKYRGDKGWYGSQYSLFCNPKDSGIGNASTNIGGRDFDYSINEPSDSILNRDKLCKNGIICSWNEYFTKDSTYKAFAWYFLADTATGTGTRMPVSGITMDIEIVRNANYPSETGSKQRYNANWHKEVVHYDWQIAFVTLVFWDYNRNTVTNKRVYPNGDNYGGQASKIDINNDKYVFRDTDNPAEHAGGAAEALAENSYWWKLKEAGKGTNSGHRTKLKLLLKDGDPPLMNAMFLGFDICCFSGFKGSQATSRSFVISNVGVIDEITRKAIKDGTAENMKHRVVFKEKETRGIQTVGAGLEFHRGWTT